MFSTSLIISLPYPANGLFLTAHERTAVFDGQVQPSFNGFLQGKVEIKPKDSVDEKSENSPKPTNAIVQLKVLGVSLLLKR